MILVAGDHHKHSFEASVPLQVEFAQKFGEETYKNLLREATFTKPYALKSEFLQHLIKQSAVSLSQLADPSSDLPDLIERGLHAISRK